MIDKSKFRLTRFPDGALCLKCGDGPDRDLVFASGAMTGDPDLEKQREVMEFVLAAIRAYEPEVTSEGHDTGEELYRTLITMKRDAIRQGIKGPYVARMSEPTFRELLRELGALGVHRIDTKRVRGGVHYELDGIQIEVDCTGANIRPHLYGQKPTR